MNKLNPRLFLTNGRYAGADNIDFELKKEDKILDVGGGNKPYIRSTHVIDMLEESQQRHGRPLQIGNREFMEGDVKKVLLDYTDDYFDFCWSSHTFEHIENLPEALELISAKCKRGYFALPASDFEFMTAKSHFGHVNLCRLIGGVLHICNRPDISISDEMAKIFELNMFNDPRFHKIWESNNCHGLRFIWEARHYWEGCIKYKFYDDPLELFPQLAYF